ncbi:MAG TPA: DUF1707 domain-containing protein [Microlunatus sp.]|nr:DUF1707 domain-containing protein [Microlunatus sp.]
MSELPISSPYRSTPDAPVTEAERNQLSSRLNGAFESGALDADDYRGRLDQLFAAQRMGELVPVVQGLPPLQTYDTPSIVTSGQGRPGELSESRGGVERIALILIAVVGIMVLIAVMLLFVLLD